MSVVAYKPPPKVSPLTFLEAVYMNPDLPLGSRIRAAAEAAKYLHPRLEARATLNVDDSYVERLKAARTASQKALIQSPRTIEASVAEEGSTPKANKHGPSVSEVSAAAQSQGFPTLRRRV